MALGPQFSEWEAEFGTLRFQREEDTDPPVFELSAHDGEGNKIGHLRWNRREIGDVDVHEDFQGRGIATSMYRHAQSLAQQTKSIPTPKHSPDRTDAGDAWARSVGGRLPRRR